MPPKPTDAVVAPNLGLWLTRPALGLPRRALTATNNVRIEDGKLTNRNVGWVKFTANLLNGPVTLIDNFRLRSGAQLLVFGTLTDLYKYTASGDTVVFLTPRYETGTVDVSADGLTVTTNTGTPLWLTNAKAGDEIHIAATGQTDPAATFRVIQSVDTDDQLTLTAAYPGAPLTNQAYTLRQLFTGTIFDYWRSEFFPDAQPADEDRWYATNGVDEVVQWNGVVDQVTVTSLGFTCKELIRYQNMMIYANIVVSGDSRPASIRNSAITEPENVLTKEAAEFVVHDGDAPIVGLARLGDQLAIYSDGRLDGPLITTQFVGTPLLFVFRVASPSTSALNGRLIADFGDRHEFVARDAGYRFDGVAPIPYGPQFWPDITRRVDPGRVLMAFHHFDEENGEVLWVIPHTTDPDTVDGAPQTVYTEHYLEPVDIASSPFAPATPVPFMQRDLPALSMGEFERQDTLTFANIGGTWAENDFRWNDAFLSATFPFLLFGDENGQVFTLNTAGSQDGAAIDSFVRFGRFPLVDGQVRGLIRRIEVFAEQRPAATYSLTVTPFVAEQQAGPLTSLGNFAYDLTQAGERFVSIFKAGRYAEIEFGTNGVNEGWELQGYQALITPAGRR